MVNGHCLGLRGASIPGAVPPLTAALATDGSSPLVTISACSLVLRGSQSRARPSRLRLPQAPRGTAALVSGWGVVEGVWTPRYKPHAGLEEPLRVFSSESWIRSPLGGFAR